MCHTRCGERALETNRIIIKYQCGTKQKVLSSMKRHWGLSNEPMFKYIRPWLVLVK